MAVFLLYIAVFMVVFGFAAVIERIIIHTTEKSEGRSGRNDL